MSLKKIDEAYARLKEYKGTNPYIIRLKNSVFAYKTKTLNDFESEYVLMNHDREPEVVNKIVKVADWFGERKKGEWNLEFTPEKLKITWLIGETEGFFHAFCIYRRSQDKAVEVFLPKKAVLTDFRLEDWTKKEIDFEPYNKRSGRTLYPYQEEAVKFLTSRKKCILASDMGSGKTLAAIVAALEDKYSKILVICPASVKTTWEKELSLLVDKDEITTVNGSTWDERKFTIINYDILKNFYTVPTTTSRRKELNMGDDGKIVSVVKEKTVVSRKKEVIETAMADSQLYQSNFDLVIIDEAHRLSNTTSGIYKIVSDLVKRSNPNGIYAITGTPITNRPINFFNILKIIGAPLADDWSHYVERYCDGKFFYNKKERDAHTAIFLKKIGKGSWYDLSYQEKEELNKIIDRNCKKIWQTGGSSNLEELQEIVKPYYLRRMKEEFGNLVKKTVKVLRYPLTEIERGEYDKVWDEYSSAREDIPKDDIDKHRKITEGIVLRQWLAKTMIPRTIDLVNKCMDKNHKVVVFCSFDEEINELKEAFGEKCVIHNGKQTTKRKDRAIDEFQENPDIKVFIGNIQSASVGITLTSGTVVVFNSFDWVPGINRQAEDRIHRLNQTKPCTVYYQTFIDTYSETMLDTVNGKENTINRIIVDENRK